MSTDRDKWEDSDTAQCPNCLCSVSHKHFTSGGKCCRWSEWGVLPGGNESKPDTLYYDFFCDECMNFTRVPYCTGYKPTICDECTKQLIAAHKEKYGEMVEDKKPAFPQGLSPMHYSIELRDLFAGFIATGMLAGALDEIHTTIEHKDEVAVTTYTMADAMLKARESTRE